MTLERKINEYHKRLRKQRRRTDVNYPLFFISTSRIQQELQGKTESSSTIIIVGIDLDTYRKWIEFQMAPDMTWDNIGHVKSVCLFDVSKDEELKLSFSWKKLSPNQNMIISKKG